MHKNRLSIFFLILFILLIILFLIYKKFDTCSDLMASYKVGLRETTFNDLHRKRELKTAIWYPVDASSNTECISHSIWKIGNISKDSQILNSEIKYPLIMFSHGFGLDRWASSWFAQYLALQGYIVVAMDHYGNTYDNMIPYWSIRPFERARDISFVLDQLLQDSFWSNLIDKDRIGMAGYSQGAAAALWVAGAQANYVNLIQDYNKTYETEKEAIHELFKNQNAYVNALENFDYKIANSIFKDSRIKAVFAMAPGIEEQFVYLSNFSGIDIPVFMATGDADEIIPADTNTQFYATRIKNSQVKILPKASHWVFLNEETFIGKIIEPKLILDKVMADRVKYHEIVGNYALNFFNKNLK